MRGALLLPLLILPALGLTQLNVVGDASALGGDCYRLTEAIGTQTGAAWSDCPLDVSQPFSMDFTVNLGTNDGGADGICLLYTSPSPRD